MGGLLETSLMNLVQKEQAAIKGKLCSGLLMPNSDNESWMFCLLWPHLWFNPHLKRAGSRLPYATWITISESLPPDPLRVPLSDSAHKHWWQFFFVEGAVPVIFFRRGLFKCCANEIQCEIKPCSSVWSEKCEVKEGTEGEGSVNDVTTPPRYWFYSLPFQNPPCPPK